MDPQSAATAAGGGTEERAGGRAGVGLRFFFSTPNESEDLNTETWHPKHPLIVPLLVGLCPAR